MSRIDDEGAQNDQFEAAVKETQENLDAVRDFLGVTRNDVQYGERDKPDWWPDELVQGCDHLENPQPAYAFWSDPSKILCGRCFYAIALAGYAMERMLGEDHCDRCGKVERKFRTTIATWGPITIAGGLCSSCSAAVGALAE